jgi:hypothetical protein
MGIENGAFVEEGSGGALREYRRASDQDVQDAKPLRRGKLGIGKRRGLWMR